MTKAADIVLYDEMGRVLLLAEVKTSPLETSKAWAAKIRHDVALTRLNGSLPRFFLVVARDRSYLWNSPAEPESPPEVQIPTDELLADYFRDVQLTAATIADTALELAVGIWLRNLTHGTGSATHVLPPQLGLATAAENGRIEFATAA